MAKAKLISRESIPIHKLVEENLESQVCALEQIQILKKQYLKNEKLEDLLKQRLKKTDPEGYQLLYEIDKRQDRVIDEILKYAEHIRKINFASNQLLKPLDVQDPPKKHKRNTKHIVEKEVL